MLVTESSVVELDGQRVGVSKVVLDVAPLKERERETPLTPNALLSKVREALDCEY